MAVAVESDCDTKLAPQATGHWRRWQFSPSRGPEGDAGQRTEWILDDVRARDVVRGVLVDHERGALLVKVDDADGDAAWALLGGEVEPSEDHVLALIRELREELGIDKAAVGRFLWSREYPFPSEGESVLWRERAYLVAADGLIVAPANTRWWSADELRTSVERFLPEELPLHLVELLEDGTAR